MIKPIFSGKPVNGRDLLSKYAGFQEPEFKNTRIYNKKSDFELMDKMNHKMQEISADFKRKSHESRKNSENLILDSIM